MVAEPDQVLAFWFAEDMRRRWFRPTAALDDEIRARFLETLEAAEGGVLTHWANAAPEVLALAIVLDQFPLHIFRGQARAFASGVLAVEVALAAVARGLDAQLPAERRAFLYMPLMHSEQLQHQDLAVQLFAAAGLTSNLRYAHHHRDLIRRFGRFPHRNEMLGRTSTAEELRYLASPQAFHG